MHGTERHWTDSSAVAIDQLMRRQREASAHLLLVRRVNVARRAEVDRTGERRVGIALDPLELVVDHFCPAAFAWVCAGLSKAGESDGQERQVGVAELRSPVRHPRSQAAIVAGLPDIRFP